MKKTSEKKKINNLSIILMFLFVLSITLGILFFTNTGRKMLGNPQLFGSAQNIQAPQEPQHTETLQPTNSAETSESVVEPAPEPVQQNQPQPQADPEPAAATWQEQKTETTADSSTVIRAGIVKHATKQIALTFDIGWLYENTEKLLDLLDEYNVHATFFVRGYWVQDHPDLATAIVNRGHALENHSLTHGHMSKMTDAEVENEIRKTTDMIKATTGYAPYLFRPPYGEYDQRTLRILKAAGYSYTILWTVDSFDWTEEMNGTKITKDYLVNRVLDKASDNGIVLMHVGGYETLNALPEIINRLRAEGYELVKVNDMV